MLSALPASAADDSHILSSGIAVTLHDVIDENPLFRVRFVAPDIGTPGAEFADLVDDLETLCSTIALPHLKAQGFAPQQIVVALMKKPVEFGVMSPNITQFFESYRIENDLCIWEVF
jgi:hypothetical protein